MYMDRGTAAYPGEATFILHRDPKVMVGMECSDRQNTIRSWFCQGMPLSPQLAKEARSGMVCRRFNFTDNQRVIAERIEICGKREKFSQRCAPLSDRP
jgi:hypothetical protein